MEPRIEYARTSDGVGIAYWTLGGGVPLVFMPVFPFNHIQLEWENPERRAFFERLAQHMTLVRYDGRGMGLSEQGPLDYSLDAHFRDLEAVVSRLGFERFALYAYLHLGPAAIAYAARNPDSVTHLILFCSYTRGREYIDSPQGQAIGALVDKDWETYKDVAAQILSRWSSGDQGQRWANLIQESATKETTQAFMRAVEDYDATDLLGEVKCPTLILHRTGLRWPPIDIPRGLASRIANARLVQLSGNTAALHLEDSDAVIRAIHDLLSDGQRPSVDASPSMSGMAVVLFVDIVDSTALTERLGDTAFRDKARDVAAALRSIIADNDGRTIEGPTLGDGVLATFSSARQAIEAALACGKAGDGAGLPLHLGLHAGDVTREKDPDGRDNVYGGAVNIAARISGLSAAGEVLVSETVRSLARTSAGVTFEERGEQALKGVGEPVRVWAVREGGV